MTRPSVKIRAYDPGIDLGIWTDIHNQLAVASGTLRIPFAPESEWKRRFDHPGEGRILVAEVEDRVVAGAGFHVGRNRTRHAGTFGMGVDAGFHGQGIGSALMTAIINLADNWYNLRRLELEVHADNEAGIALYKKFGFEVEGVYRKYAYRDGYYVDALAMARLRSDPWFAGESTRGESYE